MHLVEVTIPSGMIQFGNVKPSIAVKDPTDLAEVAAAYLEAVATYKVEEEGYVKRKQESVKAPIPEPVDVAGLAPGPQSIVVPEESDDDVINAAAETLSEGLGGVTVVEDAEAPWNKALKEEPAKPEWDNEPTGFDWD